MYYPQTSKQAVPVVLWVHGGGYVGGDKSGMKEFATRLVADSSVAFISMNYELAPDAPYPSQLQQVNELVQFLLEKKQAYPMLDLSKLLLAGTVRVHRLLYNMQQFKPMPTMPKN